MLRRSLRDRELLTMKSICKELKITPNTVHSIQKRYGLLPNPIIANKHVKDPKDPFKTKVKGREVFYSGRTVEYFERIKKLKEEGLSYNDIAKRKDIVDEKKLIESLHKVNLAKDPLRKNEDFFKNYDILINLFAKRIGGSDITHYGRLSKDASVAFKKYESVNQEIEKKAYAADFNVEDLMKKKQHIATRLSLFYEMMRAVLKKIGDLARQDSGFKTEVIEIIKKAG
jgi:hypothetical protein